MLGCSVQHVRLLMRQEKIVGSRFGRDWMANKDSVEHFSSNRYNKIPSERTDIVREQCLLFDDPDLRPIVNVSSVPQRSPFRYPGGKTWLVPIARQWFASLPSRPQMLIEPFAGGGGIGLMAAFESLVDQSLLVELDDNVAAVWNCIINGNAQALADRIRNFDCTEDVVREALAMPESQELGRAFQTILRNRVSRGGILAPGAGLVKKGEANKGIASRWYPETLAKRIEAIVEHRNKIKFRHEDGLETICSFSSNPSVAFFVDPPYPFAGKRLYRLFDIDHRELFSRLASVRGPFLATYDQSQEIQKLAEEFSFATRLVPMKSTHHARKFEMIISRDVDFLS